MLQNRTQETACGGEKAGGEGEKKGGGRRRKYRYTRGRARRNALRSDVLTAGSALQTQCSENNAVIFFTYALPDIERKAKLSSPVFSSATMSVNSTQVHALLLLPY